ncbi:MAG: glutaredoxin family protein [bacterium]
MKHVDGKNSKCAVKIYTLSTCVWCKKTKNLLKTLDVAFDYEDVDLLDETEKEKVIKEMEKWVRAIAFPLIVVDNKKHISGFDETEIKKALGTL